jgi:Domain of unknown function (DUF4388)
MAFAGDLSTINLSDVLSWVTSRRKTGTLELKRRSTDKRLVFRDGRLVSSWSKDPRETLGQALIRERLLDEQQLFEALLEQEKTSQKLGAILVARGLVTDEQLLRILRWKAEEIVYDVFLWPDGHFDFQEVVEPAAEGTVNLDMDTALVVREGDHRALEWKRVREAFPSSSVTFKVTHAAFGVEDAVERQILGLAALGKTLAAISLETRRSEFETALVLLALQARGALAAAQVLEDGASSDPVGAINLLLRVAGESLHEKRFDGALEAYERVLVLDSLNQQAKKGLIAVADARRQAKVLRKVPLDKIPTVRMASVPLSHEKFDSQEGFVLSRVNGQWDVRSILKLCPMSEDDALLIFLRLVERKVIDFPA